MVTKPHGTSKVYGTYGLEVFQPFWYRCKRFWTSYVIDNDGSLYMEDTNVVNGWPFSNAMEKGKRYNFVKHHPVIAHNCIILVTVNGNVQKVNVFYFPYG